MAWNQRHPNHNFNANSTKLYFNYTYRLLQLLHLDTPSRPVQRVAKVYTLLEPPSPEVKSLLQVVEQPSDKVTSLWVSSTQSMSYQLCLDNSANSTNSGCFNFHNKFISIVHCSKVSSPAAFNTPSISSDYCQKVSSNSQVANLDFDKTAVAKMKAKFEISKLTSLLLKAVKWLSFSWLFSFWPL